MNYEVQNALGGKVDNWKHDSLSQTVDRQKYKITELEEIIQRQEISLSNQREAIGKIIDFIAESELMPDYINSLYELKCYL